MNRRWLVGILFGLTTAVPGRAADVTVTIDPGESQEEVRDLVWGMNVELHQKDWSQILTPAGDLQESVHDLLIPLQVSVLRGPGGTPSNSYDFGAARGWVDWHNVSTRYSFGDGDGSLTPEGFVQLARGLGRDVRIIWTVNPYRLGNPSLPETPWATPQEDAAAVARFFLDSGFEGVLYEIGNEVYGPNRTSWGRSSNTPENRQENLKKLKEYAERVLSFSRAIKDVDGSARVGVPLIGSHDGRDGWPEHWNIPLLSEVGGVDSSGVNVIDFVVVHPYAPIQELKGLVPLTDDAVRHTAAWIVHMDELGGLRQPMGETLARLPIVVSEWNIVRGPYANDPDLTSTLGASLLQTEMFWDLVAEDASAAAIWSLQGSPWYTIRPSGSGFERTAQYHMLRLNKEHMGDHRVWTKVDGPEFETAHLIHYGQAYNEKPVKTPVVGAFATRDAGHVHVVLTNRGIEPLAVKIDLEDFEPQGEGSQSLITGADWNTRVSRIEESRITIPGKTFEVNLPARSILGLTLLARP
jgi:hypothetical protein